MRVSLCNLKNVVSTPWANFAFEFLRDVMIGITVDVDISFILKVIGFASMGMRSLKLRANSSTEFKKDVCYHLGSKSHSL